MPLGNGIQLLPREIADFGAPYWKGRDLVEQVATSLAESQGCVGAWHDNTAFPDGPATSRDCGVMQINIQARDIGTEAERALRTESHDYGVWQPVVQENFAVAWHLFNQAGSNNGIRRWQPWVAFTSGWAMFPAWYTWHQVEGKPVGPWMKTGRYVQRAIAGVANYHLLIEKDLSADRAVALAKEYAALFGVEGEPGIVKGVVGWTSFPKKPGAPPPVTAQDPHGLGPRPVPNTGT